LYQLRLSRNLPAIRTTRHSAVEWSRIFRRLESSPSDVLVLLDSTGAGSFKSTEGNGVTELIAACAFKESANRVEPGSFTKLLINTLQRLSRMRSFTINYLYNCLSEKWQGFRQLNGHNIDPIHVILGQDKGRPRSILFPTHFQPARFEIEPEESSQPSFESTASDHVSSENEKGDEGSSVVSRPAQIPALLLTIRIPELAEPEDLSTELFREWLRELPIPTDEVMLQWGHMS